MNFSQGHSGTKVQCKSCLFFQGKPPEFTKMGEIHELFGLALSLVWFAGATPDTRGVKFRGSRALCLSDLLQSADDWNSSWRDFSEVGGGRGSKSSFQNGPRLLSCLS